MKSFIVTACVAVLFAACGSSQIEGTDSGNPEIITQGPDLQGPTIADGGIKFSRSALGNIMGRVCTRLEQCFPDAINQEQCKVQFLQIDTIDSEIGLSSESGTTYADLIEADIAHRLIPNELYVQECEQLVSGLSCDDPKLLQAFNPDAPQDFSRINTLLSASRCNGIFNTAAAHNPVSSAD